MKLKYFFFLILIVSLQGQAQDVVEPNQVETETEEVDIERVPFKKFGNKVISKILPINSFFQNQFHKKMIHAKGDYDYYLGRLDLEFSVNASGGVKFFSLEKEKSFEMVWERGGGEDFYYPQNTAQNIALSLDPNANYRIMLTSIMHTISEKRIGNKQVEKIKKVLYKDAQKITKLVEALLAFPGHQGWRVNRFFKNYYFNAKGDFVVGNIGYDQRLRFRFLIPQVYRPEETLDHKRLHKQLRKNIARIEKVRKFDLPLSRFKLKRVWMIHTLNTNLDLGFFGLGAGKGIQLEYLYGKPENFLGDYNKNYNGPEKIPFFRRFADFVEDEIKEDTSFGLTQLRFKGRFGANFNFMIGGVSAAKTVEYHYRSRL
jgi:hypothetical protein